MGAYILPPCTFGFHGTSLTAGKWACPDQNWVEYFLADMRSLPECRGDVIGFNTGKGSQTSDWGAANAYLLAGLRPKFILFEGFGINDCAIGPVSLVTAAANFDSMVATWRAANPDVDLTHQTMSPASVDDANRVNLQAYYDQELARAAANDLPSLNHTPNCAPVDTSNTQGAPAGDKLHPLWSNYFKLYLYPTIRAWGASKVAAHFGT